MSDSTPSVQFNRERLARIDHWAQSLVAHQKLPHACVLLNQAGQEAFSCFHGFADVEDAQPITRDSVVRLYSMTKPITSVGIMQFVERGALTLDTPLGDILPEFAHMTALRPGATRLDDVEPARSPTMHEVLIHTSGLSYSFNDGILPAAMTKQRMMFGPKGGPLADISARVADLPLAFQPGARWEYSVGTDIAGRVLEVLSGQSLEDYFRDHILGPLGMVETSFRVRPDQVPRFTSLYMPQDSQDASVASRASYLGQAGLRRIERPERSHYLNTETFSGGGGLVGTIDDYMRFVEMLRLRGRVGGGKGASLDRVLAPRTVDFMLANHLPGEIAAMGPTSFAEQPTTGMGFGIGGAVALSPPRMQTPGSVGDFSWGGMASTFFWMDPALGLSVVFLTQLTPSGAYPVRAELKALVHAAIEDA